MGEVGSVPGKTVLMLSLATPLCLSDRSKQMICFRYLIHFNTSMNFWGRYPENWFHNIEGNPGFVQHKPHIWLSPKTMLNCYRLVFIVFYHFFSQFATLFLSAVRWLWWLFCNFWFYRRLVRIANVPPNAWAYVLRFIPWPVLPLMLSFWDIQFSSMK
jgi:hypothetical protein